MSFSVKFDFLQIFACVRHAVCLIVLSALSSCGGGDTTSASLPGTGGTGITASGPISGFGSVVVNGIRFDDGAAQVRSDGDVTGSGALRLGMTAKVLGFQSSAVAGSSPTTRPAGTATSIELWSVAQGGIKGVQLPNTVTVAGLTLVVDTGTVFEGAESLASLKSDEVIKVWGQPSRADFTQWSVSRLEVLKAPQNTITTGKVSLRAGKWILNGMTLANAPDGLTEGQLIRVRGALSGITEITLTAIQTTLLAEAGSTTPSTGYTELQGIVSSILSTSTVAPNRVMRLNLGASVVEMSNANVLPSGISITEGMRLQVQGEWSNGVLVARQVKIISEQQQREVEVEGAVESVIGVSNFTVRGQRFDASAIATEPQATLLIVGARVKISGLKKGTFVIATRLEIN